MKILIINGPNLNLLGSRETDIYGDMSFDEFFEDLQEAYIDFQLSYFQSNIEGELVTKLQEADKKKFNGIILNAGGYTHTSAALS